MCILSKIFPIPLLFFIFSLLSLSPLKADEFEVQGPRGREVQIRFCRIWLREIHGEIGQALGLSSSGKITLILTNTEREFERLYRSYGGGQVPRWALAVAFYNQRVILIKAFRLDIFGNTLLSTLRHEMIHIYLARLSNEGALPRYLNEGLAEWFSRPFLALDSQKKLESAVRMGGLIPFEELTDYFPPHSLEANLAYIQSHHFVQFLVHRYGRGKLRSALAIISRGYSFGYAIHKVYGRSPSALEEEWNGSLKRDGWNPLFLFEDTTLFGLMSLLVILGALRVYLKNRKILKKWEEEERDDGEKSALPENPENPDGRSD